MRYFFVLLLLFMVGCADQRGDLSNRTGPRDYLSQESPPQVQQSAQQQQAGVQVGQANTEVLEKAIVGLKNEVYQLREQVTAGRDVIQFSPIMGAVILILGLVPYLALLYGMHRSRRRADARFMSLFKHLGGDKNVPR